MHYHQMCHRHVLRIRHPDHSSLHLMSFRHLTPPPWRLSRRMLSRSVRSLTTSRPNPPAPFPTIATCPAPNCCSESPAMPERLPIDRKANLNGTMSSYAEQVIICTGKDDWNSKIEEENSGDNLAADIKELVGRGGIFSDPYHNISTVNSSFPSSISTRPEIQNTSAYLFPSFKYIPFLPRISFSSVEALVKGYLLPEKLHTAHDSLSPIHKDRLLRHEAAGKLLWGVRDVNEVVILICGHGGRDARCGVMGPALRTAFETELERSAFHVLKEPVDVMPSTEQVLLAGEAEDERHAARVGLISHIGGHKFAGNVIIYIPPNFRSTKGEKSELAGTGIWYGRVEPKHVEGIVRETILEGKVIEDMFRGGIRMGGEILRL